MVDRWFTQARAVIGTGSGVRLPLKLERQVVRGDPSVAGDAAVARKSRPVVEERSRPW